MTATAEDILFDKTEVIPIDSVQRYPKNPRVGNVQAIAESLAENGMFRPVIVQRSTGYIIGGNHTWEAAKYLGWTQIGAIFLDVDDERAAKIVLADNRTNDLATYNADLLAEVLKLVNDPVGTGYSQDDYDTLVSVVASQETMPQIEDIVRPPAQIRTLAGDDDDDADYGDVVPPPRGNSAPPVEEDLDDVDDLSNELGELQGILQLKEDVKFAGSNYYGIPDLSKKMLVQKLPDPLDTWGGAEATPDDGVTHWVWNYGVASKKDLPMDRAILCFYTYDTYFEVFWDEPAFMTAKMLNAGIKYAVVPDFSYYTDMPVATWIFNQYRAQWMGRFFQEAGIQVIPRIQFAIDKPDSASLDFCTLGIPKNAPVVAKCSHNSASKEEFDLDVAGLIHCCKEIQPETLLMYGGNPALRVLEAADLKGKGLVQNIVHIYNYAHKRRGVVYDKKEGLAAMKKDRKRAERDPTSEPVEDEVPQPAKRAAKPRRKQTDESDVA